MTPLPPLIILGASTRAAAFSAARAGFTPYWIDRFGDVDLAQAFPGSVVPPGEYPADMIDLIHQAPNAPWLYTGALENHPEVINAVSEQRRLVGNDAETCAGVRNPHRLADAFAQAGIPFPKIATAPQSLPKDPNWLIKPYRSGAGIGIVPYTKNSQVHPHQNYLQQWIDGPSVAGIFAADGHTAKLIGVTRQLVGESWLHANPFSYCGSIGPLALSTEQQTAWQHIGTTLTATFALYGLFGVDAIQNGDTIYPIEVNPRYTASVEVLERATGIHAIALHHQACLGHLNDLDDEPLPNISAGKAVLFAPMDLQIPAGPFAPDFAQENDASLADIPHPNSHIPKGHPITTILLQGRNEADLAARLEGSANQLYAYLT